MEDLGELIGDVVPGDHCAQVTAQTVCDALVDFTRVRTVLDLGCGAGGSRSFFERRNPGIAWTGVDIEFPAAVLDRTRVIERLVRFDGVHLPFASDVFDLVYSNQVFEHVASPAALLRDVGRVLSPTGRFIGSVSYLEPYHAFSLWNFTPYGFRVALEQAGLAVVELRPSIDALTLLVRRVAGRHRYFDRFWAQESLLNRVIDIAGRLRRKTPHQINLKKLLYCGQLVFVARKRPA